MNSAKEPEKEATRKNVELLLEGLDAAYRFQAHLWHFIKDPNYDFAAHGPEIVDAYQLYYLCDHEMHFVTSERKLRNKVSESPQGARILSFEEFSMLVGP
jgi:hypothetical protein